MKLRKKLYGDSCFYEGKLSRVMDRLCVKSFEYDWNRYSAWVQFEYKGDIYRFDHSVQLALERGQKLQLGTDCFAQLVLALEDLARMVERGIYELSTWVVGMKCLPAPVHVPDFFQRMGFEYIPTYEECRERFRDLAKRLHPDAGGNSDEFKALMAARQRVETWFGKDDAR